MSASTNLIARLDPELKKAMDAYKAVEGVPINVQVNKALAAWLNEKGFYHESIGKATALPVSIRHPHRVRKLRKQRK